MDANKVGGTGTDSFAALATDPQGNIYVTGSTASPNFPVKSAAQSTFGSVGLYRITASGYASLGQNDVTSIAIDPQDPNVIYIASSGSLLESSDAGNTWTTLPIPTSAVTNIAIDPFNDQNLYAAAGNALYNSTNAGANWTALNTGFNSGCGINGVWTDPNFEGVLLANACGLYRSGDAGATWQQSVPALTAALNLNFEPSLPGVIFVITEGTYESTDDGQTFQKSSAPNATGSVIVDPNQPNRLLAGGANGIYASSDTGATWTLISPSSVYLLIPATGFVYVEYYNGLFQLSPDLQTATPVGPPGLPTIDASAYANGNLYVGLNAGRDVFVAKLDPSGNVIYSTFFGGNNDDYATAIAVDSAGGVYVTGRTESSNFPVTNGAYLTTNPLPVERVPFLFKLNPDGSLAYSSYFAWSTTPTTLAVDSTGSAYLTGTDTGDLPTIPGAYQTTYCCAYAPNFFFTVIVNEPFLTKFDPTGSTLVYSTYLGQYGPGGSGVAIASDGTAYVAGGPGVSQLNATGSTLLNIVTLPGFGAQSIAIGPGGDIYLAGGGNVGTFQPTANAFETVQPAIPFVSTYAVVLPQPPGGPGEMVKMDSQLKTVLAATYFGSAYGSPIQSIAVDPSGNAYVSGLTAPRGLPTADELAEAFGPSTGTGFLAKLSSDFSALLFSSYLGDTQYFDASSVALGANGAVVIGGSTTNPFNVYLNSLEIPAPPALRIDSIHNAASLLGGPISAGESIAVSGAGFGAQSQLLINGSPVPATSQSATQITAVVPAGIALGTALMQIENSAAVSNQVMVPVSPAAPGIYSVDGSGVGQAYILDADGSLNSASNPAAVGESITIMSTGAGSSPSVFIDGIAATVLSAGPNQIVATVPNLPGNFPPQVQILLEAGAAFSQGGLAIAVQQ